MRRSQRGMTLTEVIVATMVLSMILLGLVTAMRTFANSYVSLDASWQRTAALREVTDFLRHTIRTAVFPAPNAFRLTSGDLIWRAPMDRVGSAGGVLWLRLHQEGDQILLHFALPDEEAELELESEPRWDEVITPEVLLEDVSRMSFAAQWGDGGWSDSGSTQQTGLPQSVRIDLALEQGSWPPLVVALDGFRGATP